METMLLSCRSPWFGLRNLRPSLDGASLVLATPWAKMPKLMPPDLNGIRLKGCRLADALGVAEHGMVGESMCDDVAAEGRVAVAAVASTACDLGTALIELDVVGLVRIGAGVDAGDGDVDRRVDGDVEVDHAAREMTVAAVAGAVRACRDHVGADQAEDGGGEPGIAADRDIAVAAVAADAGHLERGLVEVGVVGLIGLGAGIISGDHDVDRVV